MPAILQGNAAKISLEKGSKPNRRTVVGQSYISVPDNISFSCSQITKLGLQKLGVADKT